MNRIDIDLIAREVLAVLKERAGISTTGIAPSEKTERISNPEKHEDHDPTSLRLSGTRVLTLETLDGRLDGLRKIIAAKNAVLTPSVRDELRKRKIEIVRDSDSSKPSTCSHTQNGKRTEPAEKRTLRLLVRRPLAEPTALLTTLRRDGDVDALFFDDAEEIVQDVLTRLPQGRNVALTGEPARLLCLANRRPELCAVTACDPKQVAVDTETVGANLLVVDPKRFAPYRLAETIRAFAATCKH